MSLQNQNNSEQLKLLVDQYYQILFRYAYRLSGDRAEAEDLTQQTYLIAQKKLSQLREMSLARSWLCTILRNLFLKNVTQKISPLSLDQSFDLVSEEKMVPELTSEELQCALNELPEDFRVPLLMFYFEERSYKEISIELSIPIGTVMSRLARAKSYLQDRYSSLIEKIVTVHS
ncbi:MAG: RNA polymerase sigma factor [Gimesia sp.]